MLNENKIQSKFLWKIEAQHLLFRVGEKMFIVFFFCGLKTVCWYNIYYACILNCIKLLCAGKLKLSLHSMQIWFWDAMYRENSLHLSLSTSTTIILSWAIWNKENHGKKALHKIFPSQEKWRDFWSRQLEIGQCTLAHAVTTW